MGELRSQLGRHQQNRTNPETQKRTGSREHGILVIAEHDPRLSWPERELIRQLGIKPCGERPEGSR